MSNGTIQPNMDATREAVAAINNRFRQGGNATYSRGGHSAAEVNAHNAMLERLAARQGQRKGGKRMTAEKRARQLQTTQYIKGKT